MALAMVSLCRLTILALSPLLGAAALPAADYVSDARSIETLVNANYAYLDRFPGQRMPMTDALRAEAGKVSSEPELIRYAERALTLLADHHAITGSSLKDSWAVFPSYGDLWVEPRDGKFVISAVREDSPSAMAGIRAGYLLVAIGGQPTPAAVAAFWSDLGASGGGERDGYAVRVLAAGRRDRPRTLAIGHGNAPPREYSLANLYSGWRPSLPPVTAIPEGSSTRIRFNDSLGDSDTIAAFDAALAKVAPGRKLVIDLTDTASGGNTSVARAILGWFVKRPHTRSTTSLRRSAKPEFPGNGSSRSCPGVANIGTARSPSASAAGPAAWARGSRSVSRRSASASRAIGWRGCWARFTTIASKNRGRSSNFRASVCRRLMERLAKRSCPVPPLHPVDLTAVRP